SNETDRSVTSSEMSLRTLHEEELPAFREAIETGVGAGMMLSYNRVNGTAAHTQPELVAEARSWAPASQTMVSDAGAPTFLVTTQREVAGHVEAAAKLLESGLDSFTDNDADAQPTISYVTQALADGSLDAATVDTAVTRLMEMRLRTGEFDGAEDPYASIAAADIDGPGARELAREAAGKSVVVLRNAAGVLPLAAPSRVAVVGPMADVVLTDWYSGTPPYAVGIGAALRERYPEATVEVATGADTVTLRAHSSWAYLATDEEGSAVLADGTDGCADAALWDVTDWGDGLVTLRSRASGNLLTGGAWPMRADATRVGGWVVQESFRRHVHGDGAWSLLHLGSGRWVRAMRDNGLLAADAVTLADAERFTARVVTSGADEVARAAAAADVVVVAVGNDPHLAGRETEDRPHLWLPEAAAEVWRTARGVNAATVLTIVSSYPYVLGGDLAQAETVVWSSHGGQELGHGVVDVLTGDREPTGRLAQAWPASPEQAGDLFDYDTWRQQATYRHQPAEHLFPFGHGCTYGDVKYGPVTFGPGVEGDDAAAGSAAGSRAVAEDSRASDASAVSAVSVASAVPVASAVSVVAPAPTHTHASFRCRDGEPTVSAKVSVSNDGTRSVDELVQLYVVRDEALPIPTPLRLLVAYERVRLEPGETTVVDLEFPLSRLAVWDDTLRLDGAVDDWLHAGALRVQAGRYGLAAGPSAGKLRATAELTVRAR
ncbi:MAG: glycoside hydrolase family 3 C-terminal domain-containing protein, partial [Demequina sp.]|uniref:glycoside hydrolase family 3 C-terminal domain-containing protein n=1 Tax=Demequina sp. TaxID=2050685 RepID=UPI003A8AC4B8